MAVTTREIARGNYSSQLNLNSYKEFNELAKDFISMKEAVCQRESDLNHSRQVLYNLNQDLYAAEKKLIDLNNVQLDGLPSQDFIRRRNDV